jgi:CO dehydrogenase maturation factor
LLGSAKFPDVVVIADLEAGIGTLTRLAEQRLDAVLVVVEPTPKSIEVGTRAAALVRDKQLGRMIVVASKVRGDDDVAMIRGAFGDAEIAAIPDDPAIVAAERDGTAPMDTAPQAPAIQALAGLADLLTG